MYNYCVLKIWVDFFSIGFGYGRKYDLKKKKIHSLKKGIHPNWYFPPSDCIMKIDYFPNIRVASHRSGNMETPYALTYNHGHCPKINV